MAESNKSDMQLSVHMASDHDTGKKGGGNDIAFGGGYRSLYFSIKAALETTVNVTYDICFRVEMEKKLSPVLSFIGHIFFMIQAASWGLNDRFTFTKQGDISEGMSDAFSFLTFGPFLSGQGEGVTLVFSRLLYSCVFVIFGVLMYAIRCSLRDIHFFDWPYRILNVYASLVTGGFAIPVCYTLALGLCDGSPVGVCRGISATVADQVLASIALIIFVSTSLITRLLIFERDISPVWVSRTTNRNNTFMCLVQYMNCILFVLIDPKRTPQNFEKYYSIFLLIASLMYVYNNMMYLPYYKTWMNWMTSGLGGMVIASYLMAITLSWEDTHYTNRDWLSGVFFILMLICAALSIAITFVFTQYFYTSTGPRTCSYFAIILTWIKKNIHENFVEYTDVPLVWPRGSKSSTYSGRASGVPVWFYSKMHTELCVRFVQVDPSDMNLNAMSAIFKEVIQDNIHCPVTLYFNAMYEMQHEDTFQSSGVNTLQRINIRDADVTVGFDIGYFIFSKQKQIQSLNQDENQKEKLMADMEKKLDHAISLRLECLKKLKQFWRLLLLSTVDLIEVDTVMRDSIEIQERTTYAFERILEEFGRKPRVLREYATFLSVVLDMPTQAASLLKQAEVEEDAGINERTEALEKELENAKREEERQQILTKGKLEVDERGIIVGCDDQAISLWGATGDVSMIGLPIKSIFPHLPVEASRNKAPHMAKSLFYVAIETGIPQVVLMSSHSRKFLVPIQCTVSEDTLDRSSKAVSITMQRYHRDTKKRALVFVENSSGIVSGVNVTFSLSTGLTVSNVLDRHIDDLVLSKEGGSFTKLDQTEVFVNSKSGIEMSGKAITHSLWKLSHSVTDSDYDDRVDINRFPFMIEIDIPDDEVDRADVKNNAMASPKSTLRRGAKMMPVLDDIRRGISFDKNIVFTHKDSSAFRDKAKKLMQKERFVSSDAVELLKQQEEEEKAAAEADNGSLTAAGVYEHHTIVEEEEPEHAADSHSEKDDDDEEERESGHHTDASGVHSHSEARGDGDGDGDGDATSDIEAEVGSAHSERSDDSVPNGPLMVKITGAHGEEEEQQQQDEDNDNDETGRKEKKKEMKIDLNRLSGASLGVSDGSIHHIDDVITFSNMSEDEHMNSSGSSFISHSDDRSGDESFDSDVEMDPDEQEREAIMGRQRRASINYANNLARKRELKAKFETARMLVKTDAVPNEMSHLLYVLLGFAFFCLLASFVYYMLVIDYCNKLEDGTAILFDSGILIENVYTSILAATALDLSIRYKDPTYNPPSYSGFGNATDDLYPPHWFEPWPAGYMFLTMMEPQMRGLLSTISSTGTTLYSSLLIGEDAYDSINAKLRKVKYPIYTINEVTGVVTTVQETVFEMAPRFFVETESLAEIDFDRWIASDATSLVQPKTRHRSLKGNEAFHFIRYSAPSLGNAYLYMTNLFMARSEGQVDDLGHSSMTVLACVIIASVGLVWFALRNAVAFVDRQILESLTTFLSIPRNVVKELSSYYHQREDDIGELAVIHETLEFTHSRSQDVMDTKQVRWEGSSVYTRFHMQYSIVTAVLASLFLGNVVVLMDQLDTVQHHETEMYWSYRRLSLFNQEMSMLTDYVSLSVEDREATKLDIIAKIDEIMYIHNSLAFGNADLGLIGVESSSSDIYKLYFRDACEFPEIACPPGMPPRVTSLMQNGLHAVMMESEKSIRTITSGIRSDQGFNSYEYSLLFQLQEFGMEDGFKLTQNLYRSMISDMNDEIRRYQLGFFVATMIVIIASYILVFFPMSTFLNSQTRHCQHMFVLIPFPVVEKYPELMSKMSYSQEKSGSRPRNMRYSHVEATESMVTRPLISQALSTYRCKPVYLLIAAFVVGLTLFLIGIFAIKPMGFSLGDVIDDYALVFFPATVDALVSSLSGIGTGIFTNFYFVEEHFSLYHSKEIALYSSLLPSLAALIAVYATRLPIFTEIWPYLVSACFSAFMTSIYIAHEFSSQLEVTETSVVTGILLGSVAYMTFSGIPSSSGRHHMGGWQEYMELVICGILGGIFHSLTFNGGDALCFLIVNVYFNRFRLESVATSIICRACLTVVLTFTQFFLVHDFVISKEASWIVTVTLPTTIPVAVLGVVIAKALLTQSEKEPSEKRESIVDHPDGSVYSGFSEEQMGETSCGGVVMYYNHPYLPILLSLICLITLIMTFIGDIAPTDWDLWLALIAITCACCVSMLTAVGGAFRGMEKHSSGSMMEYQDRVHFI